MLAIGMPSGPELIIVVVIILLLFGAKKLPEMARSLGKSSNEFKKGLAEGADDEQDKDKAESTDKPAEKTDSSE